MTGGGRDRRGFGLGWWGWLNRFADLPVGKMLVSSAFQLAVVGGLISYLNGVVVTARSDVLAAEASTRSDVLALKGQLHAAANAYSDAAEAAQQGLSNLRFDLFRKAMAQDYPAARAAWLALEPTAIERWAKITGGPVGPVLCAEDAAGDGPACAALRAWFGGSAKIPHAGVWSVKRRLFVLDQILRGTGPNRVAPDRSEWFLCRQRAERVFETRRQACLATPDTAEAQHVCLTGTDAELRVFHRTHCLSATTPGGDLRTRVFCLIQSRPGDACRAWVGMDGYREADRPAPDPERMEDPLYTGNRVSMAEWQSRHPDDALTFEDHLAQALRLTELAADALAYQACVNYRARYWVIVRAFVPECQDPSGGTA